MKRPAWRLIAGAGLLASTAAAHAHTCAQHAVDGAISARYRQLGGETGPLGCPVSDEVDATNGGRYNQFEHGQIAFAPRQGGDMTIAAWQAGDSVMLSWGETATSFDKFLVRDDYEHHNVGQDDWAGGTHGQYQRNAMQAGNYGFSVQGCNGDCQGWDKTVEVYVDVKDPQGVAGGVQVVRRLNSMHSTLFDQPGFLHDALNQVWSAARGPLCDQISQRAGVADGAGKGYTLYNIVCKLAPGGVLFLDDASGTTGAVDLIFDVPHNYIEATTTQPSVFGSYVDPRFSLTYEIALHLRLDVIGMKILGVDYAVINASKPDSHNASADVLRALDGVLQTGVLRQAQAAVHQSASLNVDAINAALQRARDPIANDLQGRRPGFAVRNGDVVVTLDQSLLVAPRPNNGTVPNRNIVPVQPKQPSAVTHTAPLAVPHTVPIHH